MNLRNRSILSALIGLVLLTGQAWAKDEPDLEGRVTRIDIPKEQLLVKNELENDIGLREYRVQLKRGMIDGYRRGDKLKVWLMADKREAKRIERTDR